MRGVLLGMLLLVAALANGDADALYRQGAAVYESDPAKACDLFIQAAEAGNVSAMVGTGHCCETGTGTTVDYAKAIGWYEKAVAQNSLAACEGLARIYASCPDPEFHDGEKAVKYASAVARKNPRDADALASLAAAHARNLDLEAAIVEQKKAIRYGSLKQNEELKKQFVFYSKGEPMPAIASEFWIVGAADKGSVWAMFMLGRMHQDNGDTELAVDWFKKAVEAGSGAAALVMGDLYWNGKAVPMDFYEAVQLYSAAKEAGELLDEEHEERLSRFTADWERLGDRDAEACFGSGKAMAMAGVNSAFERLNDKWTDEDRAKLKDYFLTTALYSYAIAHKKGHPEAAAALKKVQEMLADSSKIPDLASSVRGMSSTNKKVWLRRQAVECRNAKGEERDIPKAIELYKQAYELEKDPYDAYEVGNLYLWEEPYRSYELAREWLDIAIEEKLYLAHLCLAEYYYRGYDPDVRDGAKAVHHAEIAVKLKRKDSSTQRILASAYAYNGQYRQAVEAQEQAIKKFEVTPSNETYFNNMKATLEQYKQKAAVPQTAREKI